ncbi:hypothetical protein SAMD00079811_18100 [Scytonema sp. HK-05]|uniref:hypothetical protein n=1 Tax=Scytonema sp. HK-05 TaxID=1137095 RepID=UPI0009360FFA|nr:hypothetical protein [Scytonema sp. HK-05]OKH54353.1 hypothetical protein NIES2130_29180 [Scytonema sp. HK-05]BAY44214.1 hypothetical protein SAMD00079811_18100 [Scytonema sp. HK-05]
MNRKFVFTLLSSPVLFASMLSLAMMSQPARANQTVNPATNNLSCTSSPHKPTPRLTCSRVNNASGSSVVEFAAPQQGNQNLIAEELQFTDEESEAAIAKYGCDCVACINGIRQMRGLAPVAG